MAALAGFGRTLTMAKRKDPKFFDKGVIPTVEMSETGAMLAMRALAWGSLYAWLGTGAFCYGVWKLSGANNVTFDCFYTWACVKIVFFQFQEFREKMGSVLPRIRKNDPPTSRTEFEGLNDLMGYLSTWGSEPAKKDWHVHI